MTDASTSTAPTTSRRAALHAAWLAPTVVAASAVPAVASSATANLQGFRVTQVAWSNNVLMVSLEFPNSGTQATQNLRHAMTVPQAGATHSNAPATWGTPVVTSSGSTTTFTYTRTTQVNSGGTAFMTAQVNMPVRQTGTGASTASANNATSQTRNFTIPA